VLIEFKCGCSDSCWLEGKHKEWLFCSVEFKTPVVFKGGCSGSCWLESKHKEWLFNTVEPKTPVVFKTYCWYQDQEQDPVDLKELWRNVIDSD